MAQSYSSALKKFRAGDLVAAEDEFTQVAAKSKGLDLALTLKMLGACKIMLGDTATARENFAKALKINPQLTMSGSDGVDDDVVKAFEKVKATKPTPAAKPKTTTKPAPVAVAPSKPKPAPVAVAPSKPKPAPVAVAPSKPKPAPVAVAPSKPKPAPAPAQKVAKKTTLTVSANVKHANVLVGGISIGKTEQALEVQPGFLSVEVNFSGYDPQRTNITIRDGQANFLRVDLVKSQIPPPPAIVPTVPPARPVQPQGTDFTQLSEVKQQPSFAIDDTAPPIPNTSPTKTAKPSALPNTSLDSDTAPIARSPARAQSVKRTKGEDRKKLSRTTTKAQPSTHGQSQPIWFYILPFGAGQFANNHLVAGSLFALLEAGSIYYGYAKSVEATTLTDQTNREISQRVEVENTLPAGPERDAYQQETDDFANSQETDRQQLELQSAIGFGGFAVLWAGGVIESLINRPSSVVMEKQTKKPLARSLRPRKVSQFEGLNHGEAALYPAMRYQFNFIPAPRSLGYDSQGTPMINLRMSF